MLTIALATADETTAINNLINRSYAKWIPFNDGQPRPITADYATMIANGYVYSARKETKLLGVLLAWRKENELHIENIVVDILQYGHGIAKELLNFAEEKALQLNLTTLTLMTSANIEYRHLYFGKHGFVETRSEMMLDGRGVVWMSKPL